MSKKVHAFTDDILGDLDATAIAESIKKRDFTAKEVVEATIARANKVEPELNAVVTENYENALDRSDRLLEGFFAGVPTYIKDMTLVKGIPNYYGSEAFAGAKPAKTTDPIAKKIFAMGMVNMGTSSMPEFGFTCSTEFPNAAPTRNPWNIEHTCGGSSGGAGVLVASGVVPMAHSADGGGSTRIPASCCGAVGLKPSRGRILLSSTFEKQVVHIAIDGMITRTVRDTANFYHEAEKYYKNKKLPPIGLVNAPTKKKLTIGYIKDGLDSAVVDDVTKHHFEKTIQLLKDLGHTLKPVEFPITEQNREDFKLLWAFNAFAVKNLGKVLFKPPFNPRKLSNLTHGLSKFYLNRMHRTPYIIYKLNKVYYEYQQFVKEQKVDVMVTPTLTYEPPKLGYLGMDLDYDTHIERVSRWVAFTPLSNATGCPSLTLPLGHDEEKNLPIGMLFYGHHGDEKTLLELAFQLEEAKPWKKIYG